MFPETRSDTKEQRCSCLMKVTKDYLITLPNIGNS